MRRFLGFFLILSLLCTAASGAEAPKLAALTFDDGPSGRFTRRLLEGLEARDAKATFFLCGYRMADYGDLVPDMVAGGHELALHGFSHRSMAELGKEEIRRELLDTRALLPEDAEISLMRPPGGACSPELLEVCRELSLTPVLWSVDPRDWACSDPEEIHRAVVTAVEDGAVILMHDMSDSSVDAALAIVDTLQARGWEFVTVSELARRRGGISPGEPVDSLPPG